MLLDMHWIEQSRSGPVASARPAERRVRRQRARSGFLQPDLACFAPLVGVWDAQVDVHAGAYLPDDLRMHGTTRIRVGPGGHSLALESRWHGWAGETLEHAVISACEVTGALRLYVSDTFETGCRRFEGDQLSRDGVVFEGTAVIRGEKGTLRRTVRLSPDRPSWTVSFWSERDAGRVITGRWRKRRRLRSSNAP